MRPNAKWILILAATVAFFSWRIFFTGQFTISEDWEAANQGYAYYQFMVTSVQKGIAPLWDPYTFSGRSFIGDMQAGVFYPLKLLLYYSPLDGSGYLSNRIFMQYHVFVRFLGALFMFLLAGELGLRKRISAFVSAICFGLGGFLGNATGLILLDGAIWLPLVFLFLLRALRSPQNARGILWAAFGGICLAMPVLGGGMHIPLMDVIVVVSAAVFAAFQDQADDDMGPARGLRSRLWWAACIVATFGVLSFLASAVQLFPAMEFAPLSTHWSSQGPTLAKTPYAYMTYVLWPRSIFSFLFGSFNPGFEFSPYLGVMPLALAVIGTWVYRNRPWVKYLSCLAVLAFFYTLGSVSLLHGILYVLVPFLDKAHEADRFVYLLNFAMALLAGFGVEALFTAGADSESFAARFLKFFRCAVIVLFVALGVIGICGKPDIGEWYYVSLLCFIGAWGVLTYILRGHRQWKAAVLLIAIILCDLYAFHWSDLNRLQRGKEGSDYYEQLLRGREMADFFKAQPGLFRVHIDADGADFINIGEMFGVQITRGITGATLQDYTPYFLFPRGLDLLNVRYIVAGRKDLPGQPVFAQGVYKVYENPTACPRAWIVRHIQQVDFGGRERSLDKILGILNQPDFDLQHEALVEEPLPLESSAASVSDSIHFGAYENNRMELSVSAGAPGLLVLSELYYPGWEAFINGKPTPIHKVDGLLRGIVLPQGESRVELRYRPRSVIYGAYLTGFAFVGTLVFAGFVFYKERQAERG